MIRGMRGRWSGLRLLRHRSYNFAVEPAVRAGRPLWDLKHPEDQDENYE